MGTKLNASKMSFTVTKHRDRSRKEGNFLDLFKKIVKETEKLKK